MMTLTFLAGTLVLFILVSESGTCSLYVFNFINVSV